jgi:hypothetical protein
MSNLPDRVLGQKPPLQKDYVSVGVGHVDKTIAPSFLALCIKKHAAFLNSAAIPASEE